MRCPASHLVILPFFLIFWHHTDRSPGPSVSLPWITLAVLSHSRIPRADSCGASHSSSSSELLPSTSREGHTNTPQRHQPKNEALLSSLERPSNFHHSLTTNTTPTIQIRTTFTPQETSLRPTLPPTPPPRTAPAASSTRSPSSRAPCLGSPAPPRVEHSYTIRMNKYKGQSKTQTTSAPTEKAATDTGAPSPQQRGPTKIQYSASN